MSRPFVEAQGSTEGEVWPLQPRGNPWFWTKLLSERHTYLVKSLFDLVRRHVLELLAREPHHFRGDIRHA